MTTALSIQPTERSIKGEAAFLQGGRVRAWNPLRPPRRLNAWGIGTEGCLDSHEMADHIDLLLDDLAGHELAFADLLTEGWEPQISIFWLSRYGNGGPTIKPSTLLRLGLLGIRLWIDFYDSDPEPEENNQAVC